jgi:hypothetical protein
MTKNMGTIDRGTRTIVALVAALLIVTGVVTGLTALILGIFAVVFLLTSLVGSCPLYIPFKVSTRGKTEAK